MHDNDLVKTLLIDCPFSIQGADAVSFSSHVSIFDYDLVIWDPEETAKHFSNKPYQGVYRGRPAPNDADSVALVDAIERRKREFRDFLDRGRTLIVFATPPKIFWVDTGRRDTSGTGRNQKVTQIVEDVDLLSALPVPYEAVAGRGIELELASDAASKLWQETRGHWIYRCTLDAFPGEAILRVADIDKVVGSVQKRDGGGVFAILPEPWLPSNKDCVKVERNEEEGRSVSAGGAAILDTVIDDQEEDGILAISDDSPMVPMAIYAWAVELNVGEEEPLPDWCADLQFQSEIDRQSEMVQVESSMAEIVAHMDGLKVAQAEDAQWKRLIASQGKPLERQVQAAFELLGFQILEAKGGRSDLRLDYSGQRVVVEVKGLGKSAGEKHAAQLEKWVAEELADGVQAKGILVVNGWKDQRPDARDKVFPDQMLPYASARSHCLLTGVQLLNMSAVVRADPTNAQAITTEILGTVGPVSGYENPLSLFVVPPGVRSDADDAAGTN